MLSIFSAVGLIALFAQTATSLPTFSSSDDLSGFSADLGLDPTNPLSTLGTDPGASFSSLDTPPPSDYAEALLQSQQLALNVGSSSATSTPPPPASQDLVVVDAGCDMAPKGKRGTGGGGGAAAEDTSCPAPYLANPSRPAGAASQEAPIKNQEGQERNSAAQGSQRPRKVKPLEPGSRGDMRLTPSDAAPSNPFGEKDKDPQCPKQYKHTVCGLADPRYDAWQNLYTLHDADLVINSGFGYGMLVRPGKRKFPFLKKKQKNFFFSRALLDSGKIYPTPPLSLSHFN